MSEIIRIIMIWLGTIVGCIMLATAIYLIIYWRAKSDAEKALQEKQVRLDQRLQELTDKENQFKKFIVESTDSLIKRQDEVIVKEKKLKEMLVNIEKMREESQQKVDQLTRENSRLRKDLIAARQRAKRLANKLETAG